MDKKKFKSSNICCLNYRDRDFLHDLENSQIQDNPNFENLIFKRLILIILIAPSTF